MKFGDIKIGETYLTPITNSTVRSITITDVSKRGYDYTYKDWGGSDCKGCCRKYEGACSASDNVDLFETIEDIKQHLRDQFEKEMDSLTVW